MGTKMANVHDLYSHAIGLYIMLTGFIEKHATAMVYKITTVKTSPASESPLGPCFNAHVPVP